MPVVGLSITWPAGTNDQATFNLTTAAPPDLRVGDWVVIFDVRVGGMPNAKFNGRAKVTAVSGSSFTYQLEGDPMAAPDATVPKWSRLFWTKHLLIANNTIHIGLQASPPVSGAAYAIGILIGDRHITTPPPAPPVAARKAEVCHEVIIRNNTIDVADGAADPTGNADGIVLESVGNAFVENNIVSLVRTVSIHEFACGFATYANNSQSTGELIQGRVCSDQACSSYSTHDELICIANEAFILSML